MKCARVLLEAHGTGTMIYVAGYLCADAASRVEEIVATLPRETRVIRLDIRAVDLIDPTAFVRVASALNRWRGAVRGGRITMEFPLRSRRRTPTSPTQATISGADTSGPEPRIQSQRHS
ncbi:MAG TPA: hypothetical protein VH277_15940 [Gemmatimonadaceae bacterium]|nr:hypothetical protein [Gemmatimonadaceae bacterium]